MNFQEIKKQEEQYILHTYGRVPVAIVSGKGSHAFDSEGKEYIDFTAGIGVNVLGYCPENWIQAVEKQLHSVQHICNYYYSPANTQLAEDLCKASGMAKAFFVNSGAEANECAIKIARRHGEAKGADRIICLKNSFHGRTITTLSATGQDVFHSYFTPMTEGFDFAPGNDVETLSSMINDKVCAVFLEGVQGEGGVIPMDPEYLKAVRKLCDEKGILMMMDEIQTGIGRTGSFLSYQGCGILPDVATCAKGLAGGLPIGVCLVSEKLGDIFTPGMNGTTFGGNPVVCAGGIEIVKTVSDENFLSEVRAKGEYFFKKLSAMPEVEFVRGKGMMIGVKLKKGDAHDAMNKCAEKGLLILTAKELVRFLPPLNISYEDIDAGLEIFASVIKEL